jgi:hypothetical protein
MDKRRCEIQEQKEDPLCHTGICEPSISVSIVSGYGLDDRTIEVRSPAEAKEFFL